MSPTMFRTQYRKFRTLTAKFFSYWFFIVFATIGVGDEDLLIGLDDPRYYRSGAAMHLQGRDPVRLATEYFHSLWNDPRIRVLKTETGIGREEIESVRADLRDAGREASRQAV